MLYCNVWAAPRHPLPCSRHDWAIDAGIDDSHALGAVRLRGRVTVVWEHETLWKGSERELPFLVCIVVETDNYPYRRLAAR